MATYSIIFEIQSRFEWVVLAYHTDRDYAHGNTNTQANMASNNGDVAFAEAALEATDAKGESVECMTERKKVNQDAIENTRSEMTKNQYIAQEKIQARKQDQNNI